MSKRVWINVDVGEGFPYDRELMGIATAANVCCGSHAGSVELTGETINMARDFGISIGAHPGAPDRVSMGRGVLDFEDESACSLLVQDLSEQLDRFREFAEPEYLKLHGSLYTQSSSQECGPLILEFVRRAGLPMKGLPHSRHEVMASEAGVEFIAEGFADRGYDASGRLLSRGTVGAILSEPAEIAAQVRDLASRVDSICIHGDTPGCVDIARLVRETLEGSGYRVD